MHNYSIFYRKHVEQSLMYHNLRHNPEIEKLRDFMHNIGEGLYQCKIFQIQENVKTLLCKTKFNNKLDSKHLPFNDMFIDTSFSGQELRDLGIHREGYIKGILVRKGNLLNYKNEIVGENIRYTILTHDTYKNIEGIFETFFSNARFYFQDKKNVRNLNTISKECMDLIVGFVNNFISLLNEKDTTYIIKNYSEKENYKRKKRGQVPINSTVELNLPKKIINYVDKIEQKNHLKYSHKFWVRGHWRHLKSGKYYKSFTWVMPYVKGFGDLKEKKYVVTYDK